MIHSIKIKCKNCGLTESYEGMNLQSIAVLVPYCCDESVAHIVASVMVFSPGDFPPGGGYFAPYRGVRYEICGEETEYVREMEYKDKPFIRKYRVYAPRCEGLEVYFVSQVARLKGRVVDPIPKAPLEVNTLENWKTLDTYFEYTAEPWEVAYLGKHPKTLPTTVTFEDDDQYEECIIS